MKYDDNSKTLGIIGLIFAFLLPIVTYIVSGIGLSKSKNYGNESAKKLNLTALIIAVVNSILGVILYSNM